MAWERAWRKDDGQVVLPPLVANPEDFRLTFLPSVTRRLQRIGIQFRQSRYWAESLSCWVLPELEIQVYYDPRDLSRIWARMPDQRIIEVHAVVGLAAGHSRPPRLDEVESKRINAFRDAGFEATARLERMAASATRAEKRRQVKRSSKDGEGGLDNLVTGFGSPDANVPLDRPSVQVKRID